MDNVMLLIIVGWIGTIIGFFIGGLMSSRKIEEAYHYGFKDGRRIDNALER